MGPVRVGNQAYEQIQHDAYGQIILSSIHAFFDERLFRKGRLEDFQSLERVGERAWALRQARRGALGIAHTSIGPHLFRRHVLGGVRPSGQCGPCTGARRPQRPLAEPRRHDPRQHRKPAWRPETQRLSATFSGDDLDASVLQLLDLRFLSSDDPRFRSTMAAVEEGCGADRTCCAMPRRMISACPRPPSTSAPSG
jgi:hypothetical protein